MNEQKDRPIREYAKIYSVTLSDLLRVMFCESVTGVH